MLSTDTNNMCQQQETVLTVPGKVTYNSESYVARATTIICEIKASNVYCYTQLEV